MRRIPVSKIASSKRFWLLAACVAGGAWWFSHPGGDKAAAGAGAVRVSVAPATRRDVPTEVALVGTAVARESVSIKARVDSVVTNVLFHDGDPVKEGQVLFELDDRTLKAQVKQLDAALASEKAKLVNAKLQNERLQKLVASNAISKAQADDAKAAYEAQAAQVNAAKATLDNTAVLLTYTVIKAPISGRTGTINVTRGNNVKANDTQALVTINQITPIRVQFAIPQRYYAPVKTAMGAGALNVTAAHEADPAVAGTLEYIDNTIDTGSGTFAARASFANEGETLWPGMFVNVMLDLGVQKQALTIPAVAIQGDDNSHFVFVLDADGKKAVRKPVTLARMEGETAVIADGIADGEKVVTDGILRLTDGATVEVAAPQTDKNAQP